MGEAGEFEGRIDGEVIRTVIKRNRRVLTYCYQRALKRETRLRGKLTVRWEVRQSRGSVSNVKVVESTLGDGELHRCFVNRISALTFPRAVPDGQKGIVSTHLSWMY